MAAAPKFKVGDRFIILESVRNGRPPGPYVIHSIQDFFDGDPAIYFQPIANQSTQLKMVFASMIQHADDAFSSNRHCTCLLQK